MLTGLKVSSLACKILFYRSEHNAKGGPHRTELWSSWNSKKIFPTKRVQRVNE